MCNSPIMLPNGQQVACQKCNRCRDNRIKDWVGRCIAESKTAKHTTAVTLTYGRDAAGREHHERAAVLTYSDVQAYLKRVRKHGYPVRYLVCGEYGSLKGRAHWHGIFFWQDTPPPHELRKNFTDSLWPHGHQFWDEPNYGAVKYICKYILKDEDDKSQGMLRMSKEPLIGGYYFQALAKRYVEQGIAPQGPFYRFPEAKLQNGKPVEFYMRGRSAEVFLEAYVAEYVRKHPGQHFKASPFVEEYLDSLVPDWQSSEKLRRLEAVAAIVQGDPEREHKDLVRQAHYEYYFGAYARGLWQEPWKGAQYLEDDNEVEDY